MTLKKQIIIQLGVWIAGMIIEFCLDGHVLVGGLLGSAIGLAVVLMSLV